MHKIIDITSDTVTKPSLAMRQTVLECEVGDDMVGEDPTVNELQRLAAEMLGKEKALLVPSGTMANGVAIKALTQPGEAVAMLRHSHIFDFESGSPAIVSGISSIPMGNERGIISSEELLALLPPDDQHCAPLTLVCLENTYHGYVIPLEAIEKLHQVCRERGILMHLDGARIFNASVASGVAPAEYAQYFDTVSFCLSKGLGCPVGSMVCTNQKFFKRVHRARKIFGGAMRQAGIIASCGIYALKNNVERLAEDHRRARYLAEKIQQIPGVEVSNWPIETNMVFLDYSPSGIDPLQLKQFLLERQIKIRADARTASSRLVVHLDIDDAAIERFVESFREFFAQQTAHAG